MIKNVAHVAVSTNAVPNAATVFYNMIREHIGKMQSEGNIVEVQYQYSNLVFSALLLGCEERVIDVAIQEGDGRC